MTTDLSAMPEAMNTALDATYAALAAPTLADRREAHLRALEEEARRNTDGLRAGYDNRRIF